jgi:hypothetical protein
MLQKMKQIMKVIVSYTTYGLFNVYGTELEDENPLG